MKKSVILIHIILTTATLSQGLTQNVTVNLFIEERGGACI